jgi:uncharacterized spore protein YtfJ
MEKERIIADTPVKVCGMTLIPIVQVNIHCFSKKKMISSFGSKKPLFIVVVQESGIRAFDMDGEHVEVEELMDKVPGLREMV